jgi:hypothetical protein
MAGDSELRAERDDAPESRPDRTVAVLLGLAGLVLASVLAAWVWTARRDVAPPPQAAAPPAVPVPQEQAPASSAPVAPEVRHPLEADAKPLEPQEIPAALDGLLGPKAASTFLQTDNFARRFVATVDALGREHAPPAMWPVLPTPGRFTVEERPDGPVIAAENASRYTPLVLLAGTVDVAAAVSLYRRMYPLLQQAYRDLGFGDRYLNDRVMDVIDLLLATPAAPESPRLHLEEVKGPVPSLRPWVRYQFADPELEALSAGQKILVRVGPVNQRRLKAKLAELRQELAGVAPTPSAAQPAPEASSEPRMAPASAPAR